MASASSNLEEVAQWIRGIVDAADFTRQGDAAALLGEECLDRVCERCQERSYQQQAGADGQPWQPNADGYKKTKKKRGKIIGVLTGEMLSDVQIAGEREIQPDRATVTYGKNDAVRDKLSWFNKGSDPNAPGIGRPSGAKNQPPRQNLFMIDDVARQDVMDQLNEYYAWLAQNPDQVV